jgi:hypothetical protein
MACQTLVTLTVWHLHDTAETLPFFTHLPAILQTQFISSSQTDLSTLQFRENKPGDALLGQTDVPPHDHVGLGLRLLELLVVVRLDLDQRPEYFLVLVRVLVADLMSDTRATSRHCFINSPQEDWLWLIVYARFLQIIQGRIRVVTPQVLKLIDLSEGNLTGA